MQTCNEISCLYVHACTHGYACAHMHIYAACSMLLLVRLFSGAIYSLMHCPIPHLVTVTGCAVCSSSPSSANCCCPSRGCAAASCSGPSRGCGCSGGRSCAPPMHVPQATTASVAHTVTSVGNIMHLSFGVKPASSDGGRAADTDYRLTLKQSPAYVNWLRNVGHPVPSSLSPSLQDQTVSAAQPAQVASTEGAASVAQPAQVANLWGKWDPAMLEINASGGAASASWGGAASASWSGAAPASPSHRGQQWNQHDWDEWRAAASVPTWSGAASVAASPIDQDTEQGQWVWGKRHESWTWAPWNSASPPPQPAASASASVAADPMPMNTTAWLQVFVMTIKNQTFPKHPANLSTPPLCPKPTCVADARVSIGALSRKRQSVVSVLFDLRVACICS